MSIIPDGTLVYAVGFGDKLFFVDGFDSAEGGWYDLDPATQGGDSVGAPASQVRRVLPKGWDNLAYPAKQGEA